MSKTSAQVDKLLTGVSNGYFPTGYIGDLILSGINNVKQSTGLLGQYGKEHLRLVGTVMGGAGEARRVTTRSESSVGYKIENHGLEGLITKDDYDNYEDPYDAEKDEVEGITHLMMIAREKAIADAITSTSVITSNTTLSGSGQFSDYANSDPIGKIKTAQDTVFDNVGQDANVCVMSKQVFRALRLHPALLSLGFVQNRKGGLSYEEMKMVLEVDKLLIGSVKYNSANQGQTAVMSSIWGKHMVFLVSPEAPGRKQIAFGYSVRKANESAREVFSYNPNNPPKSKAVIITDNYDDVVVDATAAYLIKDAIA